MWSSSRVCNESHWKLQSSWCRWGWGGSLLESLKMHLFIFFLISNLINWQHATWKGSLIVNSHGELLSNSSTALTSMECSSFFQLICQVIQPAQLVCEYCEASSSYRARYFPQDMVETRPMLKGEWIYTCMCCLATYMVALLPQRLYRVPKWNQNF